MFTFKFGPLKNFIVVRLPQIKVLVLLRTSAQKDLPSQLTDINFLQLAYKIDMCRLVCKNYMLFK
jgi:hypothetical protein